MTEHMKEFNESRDGADKSSSRQAEDALRNEAALSLASAAGAGSKSDNLNIGAAKPGKVIEVPPLPEIDNKDWRHHPEHRKDLPGSYMVRGREQSPPDPRVVNALDKIKADDMKKRLDQLSGNEDAIINGKKVRIESRSTYGGYEQGLQLLREKFEKAGYKVVDDTYTKYGQTYHNLRAIKQGNTKPNEVVMFGAHIDSTAGEPWGGAEPKAPGADDDGSGSVALTEIAEAIKDLPLDRTVVFSLFSGEEQGLWGSRAMAELYRQSQLQLDKDLNNGGAGKDKTKIIAMYQMDMVGYAPNSKTLESHDSTSNEAAHKLTDVLNSMQQKYNIDLQVYGAHNDQLSDRSDHYSFSRIGVPAVLISEPYDTAASENPNYHSTKDTVSTINMPYLANVTKLAAATAVELAGLQAASAGATAKDNVIDMSYYKDRVLKSN